MMVQSNTGRCENVDRRSERTGEKAKSKETAQDPVK